MLLSSIMPTWDFMMVVLRVVDDCFCRDGYMLARVTQVMSTSHYYAHLLMALDLQGNTINLGWKADQFAMELNFYYAKAENRSACLQLQLDQRLEKKVWI